MKPLISSITFWNFNCFSLPYLLNKHKYKRKILKPKDEITRSLLIDKDTWNDAMKYSRDRYKMSLSKVVESLLQEWLTKEKRKPLDNNKQGKFFE